MLFLLCMLEVPQVGLGSCCSALQSSPKSSVPGTDSYRGRAEVWVRIVITFCPSWCAEGECCVSGAGRCPGSPVCGADVTRTGILPQIHGHLSGMGPWRSPHAPMAVASWERIQPLKISLKNFSEVVANMKEMPVQGLFEAFSGKHLDNFYMAMSNSASPTPSR